MLLRKRQWLKKFILPIIIMVLTSSLTLVPLGIYTYHHRSEVLSTRSSVSFTNPEINQGKPLNTLAKTIGKTALMFNIHGDENYRMNLGGLPMLNAFVGLMFLFGVLLALRRVGDIRYFTLLSIFAVMLLPEVLSAEGIPHALRAIGVIPAIYIFSAIGISELISRWRGVFPRNVAAMSAAMVLLVSLLLASSYYDYQRYFVAWANDPATFEAYSEDAVAMADYANAHTDKKLFVVVDINKDRTLQYLTHHKSSYQRLDADQVGSVTVDPSTQIVVIETENQHTKARLNPATSQQAFVGVSPKRNGKVLYRVYESRMSP